MQTLQCDIVVVGCGAAGTGAAVAAARCGASVIVLERDGFQGGLATGAWVGTICGAGLCGVPEFSPTVMGWTREFVGRVSERSSRSPAMTKKEQLWYVPYEPPAFRLEISSQLKHSSIRSLLHTTLVGVQLEEHSVRQLDVLSWGTQLKIKCAAVVDCSGEAIVSHLANIPALESDWFQTPSIVFALSGLSAADEIEARLSITHDVREAVLAGNLGIAFNRISIVPGSWQSSGLLLKLALPSRRSNDVVQNSLLANESTLLIDQFQSWLGNKRAGAKTVTIAGIAPSLGVRTGRRIVGKHVLAQKEVLQCLDSEESVAWGSWPIEEWLDEREPTMTYLPNGRRYGIPAGALASAHLENLFAGGRNISADEGAIGSARVIGTSLQTGWAAGNLAAAQIQHIPIQKAAASIRKESFFELNQSL